MIQDPVLLNDWHAVLPLAQLEASNNVAGARLLGEDIVIWKAGAEICAWKDLCVHRGTLLSLGEVLPLDLQAELHLRSDKTAIAYRRCLNDLGLTFGTS